MKKWKIARIRKGFFILDMPAILTRRHYPDGRSVHSIGCARLPGHGFRFSFPNADGSARANIVLSENETVYGLLYQLASEDIAFFKQSEPGYKFLQKEVYVKGVTVSAFTFMASDNVTGIFPDKAYLDIILKGARKNNLPEAYIAMIINRSGPLLF